MILFYCKTCRKYMRNGYGTIQRETELRIRSHNRGHDGIPDTIYHRIDELDNIISSQNVSNLYHKDHSGSVHSLVLADLDICPHHNSSEYWVKHDQIHNIIYWRCEFCEEDAETEINMEKPKSISKSNDPSLGGNQK